VREELAILEDQLAKKTEDTGDSRETIQAKVDERKAELARIEQRLKAQQERIDNHKKSKAEKEPITN